MKPLVLFVDDDKVILKILSEGLKDHEIDVIITDNPADALDRLKSFTPDIIITDLKMEPMNGFEFFQHVKKIPRLSKVPFFFLTAVEDPLSKKYGASLGAAEYFCKPVDLAELAEAIKKTLQK
ncbi:MAG: response regulator [Ignavibacteriales bacterium]|nr:response regulator [Ignavibacteriales bacterium]